MLNRSVKSALVFLVSLFLLSSAFAGGEEEFRGYIKIQKDDAGKVEGANMIVQTYDGLETYSVAMKGKGKKLVKELADNFAMVMGKIKKKKNKETGEKEKILQVKSYKHLFLGNFTDVDEQKMGKKKMIKSATFTTLTKEVVNIQMNLKAQEAIKELKSKFAELIGDVSIKKEGKGKDKKKVKTLMIMEYKESKFDLANLAKLTDLDLHGEKKEKKEEKPEDGKDKDKDKEKK